VTAITTVEAADILKKFGKHAANVSNPFYEGLLGIRFGGAF
jgi:hypothetical protein